MLLEVRFGNFLSYKDETVFHLTAAPLKEKIPELQDAPVINWKEEKVLKASAIYGPNGGGKSNVIKALQFLADTVLAEKQDELWQNYKNFQSNPFLLNTLSEKESSSFEISFSIQDTEYRYGFEILEKNIKQEWLYKTLDRETKIFNRIEQEFNINGEYKILNELDKNKMIREDALLLTISAKFNDPTSRSILEYFKNFYFFDSFEITAFIHGSSVTPRIEEVEFQKKLLNLLKKADTGIEDIQVKKDRKLNIPNKGVLDFESALNLLTAKQSIISRRKVYDNEGKEIGFKDFPFSKFESEGTRKFFDIAAIAIEVLEKGGALFVDEIDTKFHPILTQNLIKLFYDTEYNNKNAQLIFTTHDVSLLEAGVLRRDQIWLAEKNSFGVSTLTALNEYKTEDGKGVRNDEAISKNYLRGKYGAIPVISGLN
jgi:AAA15 family ATPase/GTPase